MDLNPDPTVTLVIETPGRALEPVASAIAMILQIDRTYTIVGEPQWRSI